MHENLKHTVLVEIGVMNILIDLDIASNKFSLKELAFLKLGCLWVNKQKLQTPTYIWNICFNLLINAMSIALFKPKYLEVDVENAFGW